MDVFFPPRDEVKPFRPPSLVSILVDMVLSHRLVDDTKLLEATSRSEGTETLCLNVNTTYADLPMEIQHQVMERAVELAILDDFWIGYFIPGINELRSLNARGCNLTDAGVELLVGGCPSLLELDLSFCMHITDQGFSRLVDLIELESLSMAGTLITSEALIQLSRMNSLKTVNIKGCQLLRYGAVKHFLTSLDNIKDFLHDDWQLSPMGMQWHESAPNDDDLFGDEDDFSEEEFDPDAAHDRMVDMMNRFHANADRRH